MITCKNTRFGNIATIFWTYSTPILTVIVFIGIIDRWNLHAEIKTIRNQMGSGTHVSSKLSTDARTIYNKSPVKAEGNQPLFEELMTLARKHRPDDWGDKTYTNYRWQYYEAYAESLYILKNLNMTVIHLGVSNGGSLMQFAEFFPKALQVGLDLTQKPEHEQFKGLPIEIVYGDAQDPKVLEAMAKKYDNIYLIIDDLFHEPKQVIKSMGYLSPYLKQGGFYIIEDNNSWWQDCNVHDDFMTKVLAQINPYIFNGCHPENKPENKPMADIFSLHVVPNLFIIKKRKHTAGRVGDPEKYKMNFDSQLLWD